MKGLNNLRKGFIPTLSTSVYALDIQANAILLYFFARQRVPTAHYRFSFVTYRIMLFKMKIFPQVRIDPAVSENGVFNNNVS